MIGALALAGRLLGEARWIDEAERAADRIMRTLFRPGVGLLHCYCSGRAGVRAHLDDFSFMIWGLMELYQAGFKEHCLLRAVELQEELNAHYGDEQSGAFFGTHADADKLPIRPLEIHDGVIPSGNSLAMLNLLRLATVTGRQDYEERARRICEAFSAQVGRMPEAFCMLMCAIEFETGPRTTIAVAGKTGAPDTLALQQAINRLFLPEAFVMLHAVDRDSPALAALMPGNELKRPVGGQAAAYVCRNSTCLAPACDPAALERLLSTQTT
jgi:uncharacterized protein YyaL (SSP411 family)